MKTRTLQTVFLFLTAVMVSVICLFTVPRRLYSIELERLELGEMGFDRPRYAVYLNDTTDFSALFYPAQTLNKIIFKTDSDSVISVDARGKITGVSIGTAHLTALSDNGVIAEADVSVIYKPLPDDSELPGLYYEDVLITNVFNPLDKDYVPELVSVSMAYPGNRSDYRMTPETYEAYKRLYAGAKAATGQSLRLLSAYRSYNRQVELYEEDVALYMSQGMTRRQAEAKTEQTTNRPGCSEHQQGNSIDVGSGWQLDYNFKGTPLGSWVHEHAHEYGFILRYPADKTDITTINYEAWHFRYVGIEHAAYIYKHGICLEEYVELQEKARDQAEEFASTITATQYLESRRALS